ncbi:MAG TPA: TrmH family RNA methyltransferase, partial [Ilumatobacter sp.]|nr:TrmH family RNA methyltransferase [Ilumatobacter sp.]
RLVGELRESGGLTLYALTPDAAAIDIRTIAPSARRGVVIGSERTGLSAALLALATPVRIPMAPGVDSLNAAAAAAVACYALA